MAKIIPFEQNVERYEQWFLDHSLAYVSEIRAVKALLPKGEGVEIGVGTGRFAAPLGIRNGVEPSGKMRVLAEKRGVNTAAGTAESLPFEDGRFDFALMVATLCFVDDPERALAEAHRVLKPGGYLLVGLVDRQSPLGQAYEKAKEQIPFYREARFFTAPEVVSLMERSGFAGFAFTQTIFKALEGIEEVEPVRKGHGQGAFVVIRGRKPAGN